MTTTKIAVGAKSNRIRHSLVKVIVEDDRGQWMSPSKAAVFKIGQGGTMPAIRFEIETSCPGPYKWKWTISWDAKVSGIRESEKRGSFLKTFSQRGEFDSQNKHWDMSLGKVLGGRLHVEVITGDEVFRRYVDIQGQNPVKSDVEAFVRSLLDADGLEEILEQESRNKNFINADGQPIVSFDKGYGMTQMTNPAPTYEQVWSWKENIRVGAGLYQEKQKLAKTYLSQKGRGYTSDQLRLETWARWNGGAYHVWDDKTGSWVRSRHMLCDSQTGNIGWDMQQTDNQGKTEQELHRRDEGTYSRPKNDKKPENKWKYTGICYADHLGSD